MPLEHLAPVSNRPLVIPDTVYMQIFEGWKFRGRPKSRISVNLFS